jgi:glycosyltransferase involved in cell wall biosynthesis
MKILFIIETLGNGGAERVLVNTLPELQKLGIQCEVAILFEKDNLADELVAHGIKVHRMHLSYKWNVIEGIFKFHRLLKNQHYDIIHAHLFFAYFYTGMIKLFYSKVKTVTTFHNLGYDTYPANTLLKKLRKKLDILLVNKLIDKKVAVSNAVKEHYSKHLDISHVDLIFNSFTLEAMDTTSDIQSTDILKKYIDITLYDTFSITPGRLVKEKGHQYLLEALDKLNNIKLCHFIVGAGPLEAEIQRTIKEKSLTNIFLISGLPQKELFNLIKACKFVIIPSVSEGFPMVVGECMELGKPIIATKISGVVDMIENEKEGLLIHSKNIKALKQAIKRLYEDKNLQTVLATNAKEKIKQFDTKIIVQQWKKYYEEMLNAI